MTLQTKSSLCLCKICLYSIFINFQINSLFSQSVDTVESRIQLDHLLKISRDFSNKMNLDSARILNHQAQVLALDIFGIHTLEYGKVLFNTGRILKFSGDFSNAEKNYIEAGKIRENLLGKNHPDYAWVLNNLGNLYVEEARYETAEQNLLRSKEIREKTLGIKSQDYSGSLNNLAILYFRIGKYEKADSMIMECLNIRENIMGKQNIVYANTLSNFANLHFYNGNFETAEKYYLESIQIYEKLDEVSNQNYVASLLNLGSIYIELKIKDKAESYLLKALTLRQSKLGKTHLNNAECLNNLAKLYLESNELNKAETLLNEAKEIRLKGLGNNHPDYASSVNSLGNLYIKQDKLKEAELFFLEAKSIWEKVYGQDHYIPVSALSHLAELYVKKKDFVLAEKYILKCIKKCEKILGNNHPDLEKYSYQLSEIYELKSDIPKAISYYTKSVELTRSQISKTIYFLSENEMNQFIKKFDNIQSKLLSLSYRLPNDKALAKLCYDNTLFIKGYLLNFQLKSKKMIEANPILFPKYIELKSLARRIAKEYTKPIQERKDVDHIVAAANTLEKDIARGLKEQEQDFKQIQWYEIANKLQEKEAAIEFVQFNIQSKETIEKKYAALLIKKNAISPEFIYLCNENSIDSLFILRANRKADYVSFLYSLNARGVTPEAAALRTLYELLWHKLEPKLVGINTIYYSPCGLINRINLNAIPISEQLSLADQYQLIGFNSTRQLITSTPYINYNKKQIALLGGIHYDLDSVGKNVQATSSRGTESSSNGNKWNYLQGTEREIEHIGSIMKAHGYNVMSLSKMNATEESFKNLTQPNNPNIIHIATHGYFFDEKYKNELNSGVFQSSSQAMLRSGMILAGGNHVWNGGKVDQLVEDGILTAMEISQLDFSNTELVVLSACETGLGEIKGDEGVYGLQRAFKIAGVKYIIMSLWQVPDKQTSLLMSSFYKKLECIDSKIDIPKAFHQAQKELRDNGLDPFYWAGFVLVE